MSPFTSRELRLRWYDMRRHHLVWTSFQSRYEYMKALVIMYGD